MEPSKLIRRDADSLLEHWYDRQENQVGPTFQFKGWIDDKGKICLPVGESSEYSDGDADDESVLTRPTKKLSAAAVHASAGLATHRPRSAKTSYITSDNDRDDEGPGTTNANISPLQGQATGNRTDLAHEGRRIAPKRVTVEIPIAPMTEHDSHRDTATAGPKRARNFGPQSTRRGLEHLHSGSASQSRPIEHPGSPRDTSPAVQDRPVKRTRVNKQVSPAVQDPSPRKKKVAKATAPSLADAPARCTRSKADSSLGVRRRQKPKRYDDFM